MGKKIWEQLKYKYHNHNSSFFSEIYINNNVIEKIIKLNDELDLNADYLLPGFVDGHTYGKCGLNFNNLHKVNQEQINIYKNKMFKRGL